jgi:HK97 family phage prohead protease
MSVMETKNFGGSADEIKSLHRDGVELGILEGYLARWTPDQGGRFGIPDRFHVGAFKNSIQEHKSRNNRMIRMNDNHGRLVGGFPIEHVVEDLVGLKVIGEINLETQLGREAFALGRQGVLTDLSIGFIATKDEITKGVREIFEATIIEGSYTPEPLHRDATFELKAVVPFQDLDLMDRMAIWNPSAATSRIKETTNSNEVPTTEFKNAYLWFNSDKQETFDSYKFLIADVVDGKIQANPRAIFKAAKAMLDKSDGLPEADRAGVIQHIERYYAKMGIVSPFASDSKAFFNSIEVKTFDKRDLENALKDCGAFSKGAAQFITSQCTGLREHVSTENILDELKKIHV